MFSSNPFTKYVVMTLSFFLFLIFKSAFVFPVFSFPFFSEWFHVLALWMQSASPLGGYLFEVVSLYHLCFL